jgi:hypothetical protein
MNKIDLSIMFFFIGLISGLLIIIHYPTFVESDSVYLGRYFHNYHINRVIDVLEDTNNGKGEWICVNVQHQWLTEALSTCRHEVAHHLYTHYPIDFKNLTNEEWAQYCELNWDECERYARSLL